ncbi:hypothetical protein PLICRDRAFT_372202 [Plicaturopsis crispa FD-325 SS-3]|uniref:Unplaced genomic scaffold PLICRscaffold_19, whole genome shotgun sequence n=1 Tax=Plicaturopsis crispa FD-325 SS-3 TaxID=944288 RepID=A0A0C9SKQ7_PLICR|nr:hypothetical protein PLICRDRAFT_372202 [Plicaturopsis crispa FD-325 SS-3]
MRISRTRRYVVLAVVLRPAKRRHPYHPESWDNDFEDAPPLNLVMPKRRRPTQTLNSSDEDEFGAAHEEEDRTVTVRVRPMPLVKASPPPPAPCSPTAPAAAASSRPRRSAPPPIPSSPSRRARRPRPRRTTAPPHTPAPPAHFWRARKPPAEPAHPPPAPPPVHEVAPVAAVVPAPGAQRRVARRPFRAGGGGRGRTGGSAAARARADAAVAALVPVDAEHPPPAHRLKKWRRGLICPADDLHDGTRTCFSARRRPRPRDEEGLHGVRSSVHRDGSRFAKWASEQREAGISNAGASLDVRCYHGVLCMIHSM